MLPLLSMRGAWWLSVVCLLLPSSRIQYSAAPGTLLIVRGGTYSGTYHSTDSQVACVRVLTAEPVILRDCQLSGPGNLIEALQGNADLTILNCTGQGLRPSRDQTRRGRFLEINDARQLLCANNTALQTTGIAIYQWSGDGSEHQTLRLLRNYIRNVDGRYRDGGGTTVSAIALNQVRGLANVEIAWNQVINEPDNSLVEDNINLHNSSGTARSPINIHDNYVQGAYPYPATGSKFSGTGMITDGDGQSLLTATGYVDATANQFVSTCNSAMNIASGHHVRYRNNRMVTSGLLPNGQRLNATYCGIAVFNHYEQKIFGQHQVDNNVMGMVKWGRENPYPNRNDDGEYGLQIHTNTQHLPNPITLQSERDEWTRWVQKLQQNNVRVGNTPAPAASKAGRAPSLDPH